MLRCLSLASSFSSFLTFSSNTHTHTHPHTPSLKFSTQPNYNSTKICISFQKHRFSHFWVLSFLPSLFPLPIFSLFLSLSLSVITIIHWKEAKLLSQSLRSIHWIRNIRYVPSFPSRSDFRSDFSSSLFLHFFSSSSSSFFAFIFFLSHLK